MASHTLSSSFMTDLYGQLTNKVFLASLGSSRLTQTRSKVTEVPKTRHPNADHHLV